MKKFKYSLDNKRYHTLNYFYKNKFNSKVFKISLNANFSCPHKINNEGCIFCSKMGSGDFAGNKFKSLSEQFEDVKKIMNKKWQGKYIGYFQANTNTYAPLPILKEKYEEILNKDIIGLSIATRPDCIKKEVYDYLEDINKRTFLTIELGLQSIHEKTLKYINRGHDLKCFVECVNELKKRKINVVVHIINGLPNESKEDMIETVKFLNTLKINGIKIHMLNILKNTKLEEVYKVKPFKLLTLEEYVDIVCTQLEYLDEKIVIHRICGDAKKSDLIAPKWTLKKFVVMNEIDKEMKKRNIYQGDKVNNF